jgi:D-alanyl-D-alanine carboxypeptidase
MLKGRFSTNIHFTIRKLIEMRKFKDYFILAGLLICQTALTAPVTPEAPLDLKLTTQLHQMLLTESEEQQLPGIVMYITTPRGVWKDAVGLADYENKVVLQPTAHFRIASITKTFVAVTILKLVEEKKLGLNDPISRRLPPDIISSFDGDLTIRQLLNHTSGLADYWDDEFESACEAEPSHLWTTEEALTYAYDQPSQSEAGEDYSYYSNTNYLLLELIVKHVTGKPLAQEIRRLILKPLNLNDTFMEIQEKGELVQGYEDLDEDGKMENITRTHINQGLGLGDGGLISSAQDLAKFLKALLVDKTLLSPVSQREMLSFVEDSEGDGEYGLGIGRWETTGATKMLGHTGSTTGFTSEMYYLPREKVTVILLINRGGESVDSYQIIKRSLRILLKRPIN